MRGWASACLAAAEVAAALGYQSHGGMHNALRRIDKASPSLRKTIEKLRQSLRNR